MALGHILQADFVGGRNGSVMRRVRPLLAHGRLSAPPPPTIHTNARGEGSARLRPFRALLTSVGMPGGVTVERNLPFSGEGAVVAAAWGRSGSVLIGGISPTGGEGRPSARTRPPQRPFGKVTHRANSCGLFFVRVLPNVRSSD